MSISFFSPQVYVLMPIARVNSGKFVAIRTYFFDTQELERIADELNMSDEQQREFMLKASMKKLSAATALPKREPQHPAADAVSERIFSSEKGFLKNSEVLYCVQGGLGMGNRKAPPTPPFFFCGDILVFLNYN